MKEGEAVQEVPIRPERDDRQLRQLISGLDDGIILVDLDQTISWANERALILHGVGSLAELGATIEEYRQRFHLTYRNKRPVEKDDFPVERAIKGEKPREVTVEVSPVGGEDGDAWTHDVRCFVIRDERDEPSYMVLVIDDETDRYAAEDRFESAFNANPAPAVICRLSDLRFVRVNRGFLEMTGYGRDDIVGASAYELDVLAGCDNRDGLLKRLKEGRTIPQSEADIPLPNGASKCAIVAGQPIKVGNERCMLFTFADLEPRRRTEKALQHSEERFSKAFKMSPVALAICSLDRFQFIEINDAFAKLTGHSRERTIGRSPLDLRLWADSRVQAQFDRALEGAGSITGVDVQIRTNDGSPFDCLFSAEIITINDARCALFILQDITGRKRSEQELIAAIETVMSETSWFSRTIVEKLANLRQTTRPIAASADVDALTPRERDVLGLVCQGLGDAELAEELHLSRHTIRNHLSTLYRKIGVRRRAAAVAWARDRGISGRIVRKSGRKS